MLLVWVEGDAWHDFRGESTHMMESAGWNQERLCFRHFVPHCAHDNRGLRPK